MAVSKHVEEILDSLRQHSLAGVTKSGQEVGIIDVDPYPEETNNVFILNNGKRISTDDLEFADLIVGSTEVKIHLGDYIFHLERPSVEG